MASESFESRFSHLFQPDLPPPLPRCRTTSLYRTQHHQTTEDGVPAPPSRRKRESHRSYALYYLASDVIPMMTGPAASAMTPHITSHLAEALIPTSQLTDLDKEDGNLEVEPFVPPRYRLIQSGYTNYTDQENGPTTIPVNIKTATKPRQKVRFSLDGAASNECRRISQENIYEEVEDCVDYNSCASESNNTCEIRKMNRKSLPGNLNVNCSNPRGQKVTSNHSFGDKKTDRRKNTPHKPPRKPRELAGRISNGIERGKCENQNNQNSDVVIIGEVVRRKNGEAETKPGYEEYTDTENASSPIRPARHKNKTKSHIIEDHTGKLDHLTRYYFGENQEPYLQPEANHSSQNSSFESDCCITQDDQRHCEESSRNTMVEEREELNNRNTGKRERKHSCKTRPSFKLSIKSKLFNMKVSGGRRRNNTVRRTSSNSSLGHQNSKNATVMSGSHDTSEQTESRIRHRHSFPDHPDFYLPRVVLDNEPHIVECRVGPLKVREDDIDLALIDSSHTNLNTSSKHSDITPLSTRFTQHSTNLYNHSKSYSHITSSNQSSLNSCTISRPHNSSPYSQATSDSSGQISSSHGSRSDSPYFSQAQSYSHSSINSKGSSGPHSPLIIQGASTTSDTTYTFTHFHQGPSPSISNSASSHSYITSHSHSPSCVQVFSHSSDAKPSISPSQDPSLFHNNRHSHNFRSSSHSNRFSHTSTPPSSSLVDHLDDGVIELSDDEDDVIILSSPAPRTVISSVRNASRTRRYSHADTHTTLLTIN